MKVVRRKNFTGTHLSMNVTDKINSSLYLDGSESDLYLLRYQSPREK